MHSVPSHPGHHPNAKSMFASASGDSFSVPRTSPFALQSPFVVTDQRLERCGLLSGASEGAQRTLYPRQCQCYRKILEV